MAQAYVSLGSNIEPHRHLCACLQDLRRDFANLHISSVYKSPAVGFVGEAFLNLVVGFTTELTPDALSAYLHTLENRHGRIRTANKFAPRSLDADLLLYDQLNLQPEHNLPHQDILTYPFVLYPLAEIAPTVIYPNTQQTIAELAQASTLSRAEMSPVSLNCAESIAIMR
ncbi:MAG: 2-amino-4-hydroxy-6-hydroxymethyldihydropteridine diphosphokinase [Thiothrix sp.]